MKERNIILIFSIVLFFVSCIRYDKLQFYTYGFEPKTSCVKTEGYYLTTVTDMPGYTAYQPVFFYNDGSCLFPGVFYDESLPIENYVKKYPHSFKSNWGFYQCEGDSVFMEFIYRDDNLSKATRFELKGVFGENDELKMSADGWGFAYDYNFIPSIKPDSTQNWLKTHRKYRLMNDSLQTEKP